MWPVLPKPGALNDRFDVPALSVAGDRYGVEVPPPTVIVAVPACNAPLCVVGLDSEKLFDSESVVQLSLLFVTNV